MLTHQGKQYAQFYSHETWWWKKDFRNSRERNLRDTPKEQSLNLKTTAKILRDKDHSRS